MVHDAVISCYGERAAKVFARLMKWQPRKV